RNGPREGRDAAAAYDRFLRAPIPAVLRRGRRVRPRPRARLRAHPGRRTAGAARHRDPPRGRHPGASMSFDNPQGLWLLSLGVPILAFHFYKGRIRKMAVPMLLFWEQVIVEEERKSAFKRLRHWASLLLTLGALVL